VDPRVLRAARRLLKKASRVARESGSGSSDISVDTSFLSVEGPLSADVDSDIATEPDTGDQLLLPAELMPLDSGDLGQATEHARESSPSEIPRTSPSEVNLPESDVSPIMVMDELTVDDLSKEMGGGGASSAQVLDDRVANAPVALHALPEDLRQAVPVEWTPPDFSTVDETYPLIPPLVSAHIYWKDDENSLFYEVQEPPLTKEEEETLDRIRSLLIDLIDVSAYDLSKRGDPKEYMRKKFDEVVDDYGFDLTPSQRQKLAYYIIRDFVGLERVEPLMQDPNLEDISCIGPGIPVYVYHRKYGSLKTNVVFPSADELNRFIVKLAQMCGRHVSVANPLLEGALPDGSRVQATYAITKDISTRGSTFTIRKFTKDPLTITDLIQFGTIPPLFAAYLWLAIEYKQSILISGGTATGKTTLLNALSLFIPPEAKIVSIEDTPELRLPHEHWVQKIAREGNEGSGSVTMFDLLKAALRERPDYIVVGEVRGKEAYVLFQGMATGHPGLATIHAEDMDTLVDRLTTPPISLPASLLHALDIIIFMGHSRIGSVDVRRTKEIHELVTVDLKTSRPVTSVLGRWIPGDDRFEFVSDKSYILDKIIQERGISADSIWGELRRRAFVLKWMRDHNIRYYRDVGKIIARYYKEPEALLEEIGYAEASNEDSV
jgi:flagellar protein FlaI